MRIKGLDSLNLVVKSRVAVVWKASDSHYPSWAFGSTPTNPPVLTVLSGAGGLRALSQGR